MIAINFFDDWLQVESVLIMCLFIFSASVFNEKSCISLFAFLCLCLFACIFITFRKYANKAGHFFFVDSCHCFFFHFQPILLKPMISLFFLCCLSISTLKFLSRVIKSHNHKPPCKTPLQSCRLSTTSSSPFLCPSILQICDVSLERQLTEHWT